MLLKPFIRFLAVVCCLLSAPSWAYKDIEDPSDVMIQLGLDQWTLHPSVPSSQDASTSYGNNRLYLANSDPVWTYHDTSPWMRLSAQYRLSPSLTLRFKARADQSLGTHLDDMHIDWAFFPTIGVRAGVVDYKTNWCRTYETDLPWVRENDPFCANSIISAPTASAPGVQAYANLALGRWRLQSIAGIYNPMMFGYDANEFSIATFRHDAQVTHNRKVGLSFEAINAETATELRLSALKASQSANWDAAPNVTPTPLFTYNQNVATYFAGISQQLTPQLMVQLHRQFNKVGNGQVNSNYTDLMPYVSDTYSFTKSSSSLEFHYQITPQDKLALGYSLYSTALPNSTQSYYYPDYSIYQVNGNDKLNIDNISRSLGWRHDFERGFFAAIQYTYASVQQLYVTVPYGSTGQALGIRVGYTY